MLMLTSELHPSNAFEPISVIEFGSVTVFRYLQFLNPESAIYVTGFPLIVLGIVALSIYSPAAITLIVPS